MTSLALHWFTPHYSNNHRPKVLHPIGLSMIIGLFLVIQASMQLFKLTSVLPGGYVLGYASSISPSQVVDLTNVERAKVGLPGLIINDKLNQAALAKANHMFQHDYWAHVAPDGTSPWVFIKNAGYSYSVAGENLARDFNDTSTMVQAWINSPTHKANIVHQKYSQIGIAVVNGKLQGVETTLVVQMFGTPITAAVAKTTPKAAISTAPIEINELSVIPENAPIPSVLPIPTTTTLTTSTLGSQANVKTISPLTATKIIASILITLLVFVLGYDSILHSKRNLPRKVGNNWAHIAFFGIVLVIIMALTEGNIM